MVFVIPGKIYAVSIDFYDNVWYNGEIGVYHVPRKILISSFNKEERKWQ